MIQKKFSGVVVPMITPLNNDFSIDTEAVNRIITSFSKNDIHPLILGTTGESSSVGEKDSLDFMAAAVAAKGPSQFIYAGLVGNQVSELLERGNRYLELGADAVVATLPAYYILTPAQMIAFYTRLADESKGPVIMYNIKATTQMSIPLDVVEILSKHPNIHGLKDSERDAERMSVCIERFQNRPDFSYFSGWGAQSSGSLALGADGIVPSTGNIVPEWYQKLYAAARRGDFETAISLQTLTDEVAVLYQENRTLGQSLAALKVMMNSVGLCGTTMMPPLTELSAKEAEEVVRNFNEYRNR
jgi:dihydrodipicolinate synthase/N-acetylneuraminate lyase